MDSSFLVSSQARKIWGATTTRSIWRRVVGNFQNTAEVSSCRVLVIVCTRWESLIENDVGDVSSEAEWGDPDVRLALLISLGVVPEEEVEITELGELRNWVGMDEGEWSEGFEETVEVLLLFLLAYSSTERRLIKNFVDGSGEEWGGCGSGEWVRVDGWGWGGLKQLSVGGCTVIVVVGSGEGREDERNGRIC